MSIISRILGNSETPTPPAKKEIDWSEVSPRAHMRGLVTRISSPYALAEEFAGHSVSLLGPKNILHPPNTITYWRDYGFDTNALGKASSTRLLEIMSDLSPDLSRALWDFLRFSIPGWEIVVTRNANSATPYRRGQAALDNFLGVLAKQHGTLEIMFGKLFMAAFIRGAFFSELVIGPDRRTPIGLNTPDPAMVRFRRSEDPDFGTVFELGRLDKENEFVSMDRETVIYLPIDPFPNSPYGRAPANPAVFSLLFLVSMMNDIKRVIAQQGYPRLNIEIDLPSLAQIMPEDLTQDPQVFNRWVAAAVSEVKTAYANLQPDDAFVHTSMVKIHSNAGTLDVNSLGMVNNIIDQLESMAMKALKSMPLLMGATEGMSEANANRQWEVFVAGIKSLQHHCENMLERQFELALQSQGVGANVIVRFAELRTAELLRDEMTRQMKIDNSIKEYAFGAVDFETMVLNITGKKPPAGVSEPLFMPKTFVSYNNAIKAEAASEGSAAPGQEGGDTAPVEEEESPEDRAMREIVYRAQRKVLNGVVGE